ncbi:MAG: 23S rRNA (uracil(1939)-C(5))-methyltransferase RlmD, partial [Syntrophomonas sp.]
MRCLIDGITHSGEGVARIEGKATFVLFAIPGETVEVDIIEDKRKFRRARLTGIVKASSERTEPRCPHYYECGGCAYQHMTYNKQLELKQRVVSEAMQRIGKLELPVNPVLGMEEPWRYRNKVTWHTNRVDGRLKMGFYQNDTHQLIDIKTCKLISEEMEKLSLHIKANLEELNLPEACEIIIRQSSLDHKLMLIIVSNGMKPVIIKCLMDYPDLSSIYSTDGDNHTLLYGQPYLQEAIDGIYYDISPMSFFQVNPVQTGKLFALVQKYAGVNSSHRVLDAYCGIGSISLMLVRNAQEVLGVEGYAPAVEDAINNARKNHINNCSFLAGPCEKLIPRLHDSFDLVVLDPPRAGGTPDLIQAITRLAPRRIVYVSC